MKMFITVVAMLLCLLGGFQSAHAAQPRICLGPFVLNSANYAPSVNGVNVRHLDGDLTVHLWKTGADAISVNIEGSLYDSIEDPLGGSFKILATRTGSEVDSLVGPLETVRFNVTSCGTDCLTKAKICGRISN